MDGRKRQNEMAKDTKLLTATIERNLCRAMISLLWKQLEHKKKTYRKTVLIDLENTCSKWFMPIYGGTKMHDAENEQRILPYINVLLDSFYNECMVSTIVWYRAC